MLPGGAFGAMPKHLGDGKSPRAPRLQGMEGKDPAAADPPRQIHELLEAIAEKEKILAQRRKAAGLCMEVETSAAQEAESIEQLLAHAQEEWRGIEKERADVVAQYEACQHNKVQHTQADEFRKEIVNVETELQKADDTIADLERQLHGVSAAYKNERERRMLMLSKFRNMVDELRDVVTRKIEATIRDDEADAKMLLRMISEISRERETEVSQWKKYSKEMAAVVELKRARTSELQMESERRVQLLAEAKSQEIRELSDKCAAERNAITADIRVLEEVNRKQLEQLRTVRLSGERGGKLERDPKSARSAVVPAERFLSDKLQEHEQERETLETALRSLASERQRLQTTMRTLQQEMETDAAKHQRVMHNLGTVALNERQEISLLERDNRQLKDLCDSLAATLRSGYVVQ